MITKAKEMIKDSKEFIEDTNLAPCDSLLSKLSQVPRSLYKTHLIYVKRACDEDICNDFSANANIYGVTYDEAEKDIKATRDIIEKKRDKKNIQIYIYLYYIITNEINKIIKCF